MCEKERNEREREREREIDINSNRERETGADTEERASPLGKEGARDAYQAWRGHA